MDSRSIPVAIAATIAMIAAASPAAAAAAASASATATSPVGEKTRVIVAFKPGTAAAVRAAIAAARGVVKHEIFGMDAVAIEVPTQALSGLARNPNVEYVEEDVERRPLSSETPSTGAPYASGQRVPYGVPMVQADKVPDAYAGNRTVCIIDSGYDLAHEDLAGNPVTGEFDAGTGWWYTDENHHGTHVAGTIAAINNGVGVVGVNPNGRLRLHIVKVFGATGWTYSSTLASAANKCGAASANVINMSLGGAKASKTEQRAFDALLAKGVLPIAAAGNSGNSDLSYPAAYASVVSVAAVDENKAWAAFSQYNSDVELAAPGVNVLSTIPTGTGTESALTVGTLSYAPGSVEGSPKATAVAPLADFGLGDRIDYAMKGQVCLIARGSISFATKVSNCQASGGAGAVIYNNVAGSFTATLGTTLTVIPSVTASQAEGVSLRNQPGQQATVRVAASNYAYFNGTSMATPHVAAVAALVWSHNPSCTATQMRNVLARSALDLGPIGRDAKFGHGLVQAEKALTLMSTCGN